MFQLFLGFFLPLLGTVIGAAVVFVVGKNLNQKFEQLLLGFASGMMMAASVWSLLLPALNQTSILQKTRWLPAVIGFAIGVIFLLFVDVVSIKVQSPNKKSVFNGKKIGRMMLAITIHNIPEGMAVGVAIAGAYYGHAMVSVASALSLAIGIAVQNIPDGAMVSLPLYIDGNSKVKSFWLGVFSAILELVSALLAFFLTELLSKVLPYILAFASGATIFVIVKDLIPASQAEKHKNLATVAFVVGFLLMIVLDATIGWFVTKIFLIKIKIKF